MTRTFLTTTALFVGVLLTACGGEEDTGDNSEADSPAGSGGESSVDMGTGGLLEPTYGSLGSGEVDCDFETCAAGTVCCSKFSEPTTCVASFEECVCGEDLDCQKFSCNEPSDCPGQFCCATTYTGYSGNIEWAGASCKDTCDPVMDTRICIDDNDCEEDSTFGCGYSSLGPNTCD